MHVNEFLLQKFAAERLYLIREICRVQHNGSHPRSSPSAQVLLLIIIRIIITKLPTHAIPMWTF